MKILAQFGIFIRIMIIIINIDGKNAHTHFGFNLLVFNYWITRIFLFVKNKFGIINIGIGSELS